MSCLPVTKGDLTGPMVQTKNISRSLRPGLLVCKLSPIIHFHTRETRVLTPDLHRQIQAMEMEWYHLDDLRQDKSSLGVVSDNGESPCLWTICRQKNRRE